MKITSVEISTFRLGLTSTQREERLKRFQGFLKEGWRIEGVFRHSDWEATFFLRRRRWFWQKGGVA